MIWKVDASAFEGWGQEHWDPQDFDPVARIDASPRKIGQVLFHPTAAHVLASASGEHTVKVWDLSHTEDAKSVLVGHGDAIQCIAFNPTGTLLATTCRDRKLRLFDPRVGGEAVRITDGHGGIKGSRVAWMGDLDKIATTGFSKMSDRQVGIWETGGLGSVKTISLDQSSGVVMPFWTDNNILFLGKSTSLNVASLLTVFITSSWQGVNFISYSTFAVVESFFQIAATETSDTTNGNLIPCTIFPSTSHLTLSEACASFLAVL